MLYSETESQRESVCKPVEQLNTQHSVVITNKGLTKGPDFSHTSLPSLRKKKICFLKSLVRSGFPLCRKA